MQKSKLNCKGCWSNMGLIPKDHQAVPRNTCDELGISSIRSTLGAPRPWADLKAKASSCKPPIQLVLSEELKKVIDEKIRAGQPFGRKDNKKQTKTQAEQIVDNPVFPSCGTVVGVPTRGRSTIESNHAA